MPVEWISEATSGSDRTSPASVKNALIQDFRQAGPARFFLQLLIHDLLRPRWIFVDPLGELHMRPKEILHHIRMLLEKTSG